MIFPSPQFVEETSCVPGFGFHMTKRFKWFQLDCFGCTSFHYKTIWCPLCPKYCWKILIIIIYSNSFAIGQRCWQDEFVITSGVLYGWKIRGGESQIQLSVLLWNLSSSSSVTETGVPQGEGWFEFLGQIAKGLVTKSFWPETSTSLKVKVSI